MLVESVQLFSVLSHTHKYDIFFSSSSLSYENGSIGKSDFSKRKFSHSEVSTGWIESLFILMERFEEFKLGCR